MNEQYINRYCLLSILVFSVFALGCERILEEKTDAGIKVPETIDDLEALLNNSAIINNVPSGLGEVSSDNVVIAPATISGYSEFDRNIYSWRSPIMPADGTASDPWTRHFRIIYTANLVMETAQEIKGSSGDQLRLRVVLGRAHFLRAYHYLALIGTWRGPLVESRENLLGVPVRTFSDINRPNPKSTIAEVYALIGADVRKAVELLPEKSFNKVMPDQCAAYALASRMCLMTGDYAKSAAYADSALNLHSDLLDYNQVNLTANYPFRAFGTEVLFHVFGGIGLANRAANLGLSPALYELYDEKDLRKRGFFVQSANGSIRFKGSYNGTSALFTGLTTAEVLLDRAEALVRIDKIDRAKEDLMLLVKNRYEDTFDASQYIQSKDLLSVIKGERRKELVMRDRRWTDMKRYYYADGDVPSFSRSVGDQQFEFSPEKFDLPYPDNFLLFNDYGGGE